MAPESVDFLGGIVPILVLVVAGFLLFLTFVHLSQQAGTITGPTH
jgi:hypothetical protein